MVRERKRSNVLLNCWHGFCDGVSETVRGGAVITNTKHCPNYYTDQRFLRGQCITINHNHSHHFLHSQRVSVEHKMVQCLRKQFLEWLHYCRTQQLYSHLHSKRSKGMPLPSLYSHIHSKSSKGMPPPPKKTCS